MIKLIKQLKLKGLPLEDVRQLEKRFNEIEKSVTVTKTSPPNKSGSSSISDKHFVYNQTTPSALWIIVHDLNKYPSITVVDSAGTTVIGEARYVNQNTVEITFSSEFSGKAYLN